MIRYFGTGAVPVFQSFRKKEVFCNAERFFKNCCVLWMEEGYTLSIPRPNGEKPRSKQYNENVKDCSSPSVTRKYVAVVFVLCIFISISKLAFAASTWHFQEDDSSSAGMNAFSTKHRHRFLRKDDYHDASRDMSYKTAAVSDISKNNTNESCSLDCCQSFMETKNHRANPNERRLESTEEGEDSWVKKVPFPLQYILIVILILLSALFSGLTLGLMGLDKTGLEIVMDGDDKEASEAARAIYPVRANGNRLLCTLLLGNVAVNALLSILMADISGGLIGFLVSTISIVIFGEILPQAACSRYALQIGRRTVPLVKFILVLFCPVSAPIAFCLDKILGHELGTTYSKAEMRKLLEIHVKEGRFNQETGTAMTGALKYQVCSTYSLYKNESFSYWMDGISFFFGIIFTIPYCETSNNICPFSLLNVILYRTLRSKKL